MAKSMQAPAPAWPARRTSAKAILFIKGTPSRKTAETAKRHQVHLLENSVAPSLQACSVRGARDRGEAAQQGLPHGADVPESFGGCQGVRCSRERQENRHSPNGCSFRGAQLDSLLFLYTFLLPSLSAPPSARREAGAPGSSREDFPNDGACPVNRGGIINFNNITNYITN